MSDFVTYSWYGISAPAGTPDAIVQKLNKAIVSRLQQENLSGRLALLGVAVPPLLSPKDFHDFVALGVQSFSAIAKQAAIQLD